MAASAQGIAIAALRGLAAGLGLLLASSAVAAPCAFKPDPLPAASPTFAPIPPRFAASLLVVVRGATVETPFRLEARATGPVVLRWHPSRPLPTVLALVQRLTITQSRDEGATFEPYCETSWTPASQMSGFAKLLLETGSPVLWRVEVWEENLTQTITVLDEERPLITMSGALEGTWTSVPRPLPGFDGIQPDGPSPTPRCQVASQAATSDAVAVKAASIPEGGLQIIGSIFALSGRTLHVRIDRPVEGPKVMLIIKAKPVGYGIAPKVVCALEVEGDTLKEGEWITATAPWMMTTELRWFISLDAKGRSPQLRYHIFRERPLSMTAKNPRPHSTDAYSCLKPTVEKPATLVDPLLVDLFQGAYALTIRTNLGKQRVSDEGRATIVDAILTSIDGWRMVCIACTPYQFSIIDIDGQVYVPAGMLQGKPDNFRATFINNYPWDWRVTSRKSTGLFSPVEPFVRVELNPRQRQRFCLQLVDETGFSAADSPLCRPSPPSTEQEMIVNLEWRAEGLDCDDRPTVVACWNGSDRIELNLKDFSFYVGDTGDTLLGTSAKGADLIRVFGHEVGHWLGLGHMSGDRNIMSDELADAQCIDDKNLRRVNQVARGEVREVRKREALRYE